MSLMYARSGIETRYSVIPDYSCEASERTFFSQNEDLEPFPSIEKRMAKYQETALPESISKQSPCVNQRKTVGVNESKP